MIYLICQEWDNTSKNHAGMKYLCEQMVALQPKRFKTICIPDLYCSGHSNRIFAKIHYEIVLIKYKRIICRISKKLNVILEPNDKMILMEYLERLYPQVWLAKKIKQTNANI